MVLFLDEITGNILNEIIFKLKNTTYATGLTLYLFIAPPLKIRFAVPVERVETTILYPRVESRCFNPLHSYSQSDSEKSCYDKKYTLLETKHSESNSCDCSPRFTRAANFTLIAIAMFRPL